MSAKPRWNRVVCYARISTDDQTNEQQVALLKPWAEAQSVHCEIIVEEESSRNIRPNLEAIRVRLLNAEIDAFVVWKLDRIGRSAQELLRWRYESDYVGFNIISYSEAIDLKTPAGRLMYTILAGFAEYERDVISQRTKFKLDHLRSKGIIGGTVGGKIFDPVRAKECWKDMSVRELARELGVSNSTAGRVKRRFAIEEERKGESRLRPMKREALAPELLVARVDRLEAALKAAGVLDPDLKPVGEPLGGEGKACQTDDGTGVYAI